jgi:hypothetical protein
MVTTGRKRVKLLVAVATKLLDFGLKHNEVLHYLAQINRDVCHPPLSSDVVLDILLYVRGRGKLRQIDKDGVAEILHEKMC